MVYVFQLSLDLIASSSRGIINGLVIVYYIDVCLVVPAYWSHIYDVLLLWSSLMSKINLYILHISSNYLLLDIVYDLIIILRHLSQFRLVLPARSSWYRCWRYWTFSSRIHNLSFRLFELLLSLHSTVPVELARYFLSSLGFRLRLPNDKLNLLGCVILAWTLTILEGA